MDYFNKIIQLFVPILLGLLIIEKIYGHMRYKHEVRSKDIITGIGSGMTNILKDLFGLTIFVGSYQWLYDHFRLMEVGNSFWTYLITFIIIDFAGYWWHRLMHRVNILWNEHLVHHSSEEFDLASALRQPISNIVTFIPIFIFPAALIGVPPAIIGILTPIHVFAQYWYHTKYIGRLGFLEKLIVTPSHHRVHHAQNPEYLDKNLGLIFIFWDKIFGTFQNELKDVPPVYGVTRPVKTWNPIKINFAHFSLLFFDAIRSSSWVDKVKIWFMPTGWRPEGFEEKYPVDTISDVKNMVKYDTHLSKRTMTYVWVQFFAAFVFFILLVALSHTFYFGGAIAFGLMIGLSIYAYSELLDRRRSYIVWILIRDLAAIIILTQTPIWVHLSEWGHGVIECFSAFFILSIVGSLLVYFKEFKNS